MDRLQELVLTSFLGGVLLLVLAGLAWVAIEPTVSKEPIASNDFLGSYIVGLAGGFVVAYFMLFYQMFILPLYNKKENKKRFIALVGVPESGKTSELDRLVDDTNGLHLRESTTAITSINNHIVFIKNCSPQEKGRSHTIRKLKEFIDFFEEMARNILRADSFIIIMAFTVHKRHSERISQSIEHIKQRGYEFDQITKIKNKPKRLLPILKNHLFFR